MTNKKRGPAVSLPILRGGFVPGRGILKNSFGDLITSRTRRLISQVLASPSFPLSLALSFTPRLAPSRVGPACNRYHGHTTTCVTSSSHELVQSSPSLSYISLQIPLSRLFSSRITGSSKCRRTKFSTISFRLARRVGQVISK